MKCKNQWIYPSYGRRRYLNFKSVLTQVFDSIIDPFDWLKCNRVWIDLKFFNQLILWKSLRLISPKFRAQILNRVNIFIFKLEPSPVSSCLINCISCPTLNQLWLNRCPSSDNNTTFWVHLSRPFYPWYCPVFLLGKIESPDRVSGQGSPDVESLVAYMRSKSQCSGSPSFIAFSNKLDELIMNMCMVWSYFAILSGKPPFYVQKKKSARQGLTVKLVRISYSL